MRPLFDEPQAREDKPLFSLVPAKVLLQIESLAGEKILGAETVWGGYSASASYVLTLASGKKLFAKGNHPEEKAHGTENLRQEVFAYANVPVLKEIAPQFLGLVSDGDEDGWMLGLWEHLDGAQSPAAGDMVRALAGFQQDAGAALRNAGDQNYISLFLNEGKKWLRLRDEPKVAARFLALFEDTGAATDWLERNLPALCALQRRALDEPHRLLHGDLRSDNFIRAGQRIFVVDWPNACRGPVCFDPLMLFAELEARGISSMSETWRIYGVCGGPASPEDAGPMAARLAGFMADQASRNVPEKLPRLRWMQKGILAVLLRHLHTLGIIDSTPRFRGEKAQEENFP